MCTYNSGIFKGAKPYTINQNGAKVTSLLGRVKQTFSKRDSTISKWRVIHLMMHYVDGVLFFQMGFIFLDDYESKVDFTWSGVLFGFLSKWFGSLEFISNDLRSNWKHFSFHGGFWNWHVIYWWWSSLLKNVYLTRPNREVTFAPFLFKMYGFCPILIYNVRFCPIQFTGVRVVHLKIYGG